MPTKNIYFSTVQETNDSSILSKASISRMGYFDDPYLQLFTTRPARRSPLIHRGYYARAKGIDYLLTRFLKLPINKGRKQIISLGCGFDSSYYRLKSKDLLKNCSFYEIDFPEVIARKIQIIEKQDELKKLIGSYRIENHGLIGTDYYVIPCDLTNEFLLKKYFAIANLDYDLPTLFISECVLTYVDYDQSSRLLYWIRSTFKHFMLGIYEQINPDDGFGKVMLTHFNKIQSPLKRINKLKDITRYKDYLINLGYDGAIGLDMNYFYDNYVEEEEKEYIKTIEPFDEFEEFHLKCSHYCIMVGYKGELGNLCADMFLSQPTISHNIKSEVLSLKPWTESFTVQRYGHTCMHINDNEYLIIGGFGVTSINTHEKLSNAMILKKNESSWTCNEINADIKRMFHTATWIGTNKIFLYGGRTSPKKSCSEYGIWNVNTEALTSSSIFKFDENLGMPPPRWRHSAAYYNGKIFIFGGITMDEVNLNDLWAFDLSTNLWKKECLDTTISPRHSHTMDVWNGCLVIYGGLSPQMKVLDELYIISNIQVTACFQVQKIENPFPPRYSHTTHVIKDNLIVVGGINPDATDDFSVVIISLLDFSWRGFHILISSLDYPFMLHNHCSTKYDDNSIAIIGGGGNCFSFGTHFNQKPHILSLNEILN